MNFSMFGEKISGVETLFISLFSIVFVFIVLWLISYFIKLISIICAKFKKNEIVLKSDTKRRVNALDNSELVAVITSSIMAYNGNKEIIIKSVNESKESLWGNVSKVENQKN